MEDTVSRMLDKLDIDSSGKPRWTSDSGERASWEWRRVRRSFRRKEREKMINDLQYWNTALKNIFEKAEIPLDEPSPLVDEVQARFNAKLCDATRQKYRLMHEMMLKRWSCGCEEHRANIRLDWHTSEVLTADNLTIVMESGSDTQLHAFSLHLQASDECIDVQPVPERQHTRSPSPSRFDKLKDKLSFRKQMPSTILLMPPLIPREAAQNTSSPRRDISCLCAYLKNVKQQDSGYISSPDEKDRCLMINMVPSSQRTSSASLESFLSSWNLERSPTYPSLSRKERFSIAAAVSWAILYLSGSPWMGDDWGGKDEIKLFIESAGAIQRLANHPTLGHVFNSASTISPTHARPTSETERFQSSQIRNKVLFSLGILLIELCLNKTFQQIRQESQADRSLLSTLDCGTSAVDDFEIADRQTDKVYLDAGNLYGYAVQRCLRCEFPGRDVTKNFDFKQFRQNFFTGVVAPVQATYMMQPSSVLAMRI
ncbi:hypothetical protein K449DRAFT_436829 [Hypoxylon sp. EC38]|nr:hypothetical protein K449DRAFT_436829 [Hypoxylon sp. EC38]